MADNLKPTRRKLQKYFSKPIHSAPEPDCKEWNANDLSSAIKMAGMQMGSLGNPKVPISPVVRDSSYKPALARVGTEQRLQHKPDPTSEVESIHIESCLAPPKTAPPPPPQHSPPPPPPATTSFGAAVPSPQRLPPPPPPPHVVQLPLILDATSGETDPMDPRVRRGPSLINQRPVSGFRRRFKTPVHKIGQLEMAAAKKRQEAATNRQSSVRSIARQYRTLIEEIDVPTVHRKPLPATAAADPDAVRLQIGFELLTRELSTALADRSANASRDASGLQIRVMIEAYERLRDRISAMEVQDPQLKSTGAIFESWLDALRTVQRSFAIEGAESESEYGDE
ncbi:hypothetical protein EsDP_00004422 [Epichloe bromicola]|uniref:Mating-type switching protein swi10 n=1 Tax=Epichloe bromicola TaxID=79588 RepID=A0ABQ0CRP1_9HYPO